MNYIGIVLLIASLFLIPIGAPGLLGMVIVLAAGTWLGYVSLSTLAIAIVIAVCAEAIEFVILKRLAGRYGGSRRAFWGALVGGFAGVIIGVPIPIVGSLIAGLLGTFAGAAAVTWLELRDMGQAGRVGWGLLMGRMFAAAVKTAAGVIVLIMGTAALLR